MKTKGKARTVNTEKKSDTTSKLKPANTETESDTPPKNKKMKISKLPPIANKIGRQLYDTPAYDLANYLLGKILVRKVDDCILKGRIVETECYPGGDDQASSTRGNRRTPAVEPLYMQSGTAFVYMTYGMYHCMNISSSEPGGGVLLRALEPIQGSDKMQELRMKKRKSTKAKALKEHELCNGPSKLCASMDIRKDNCNTLDFCENDELWIETDPDFKNDFQTVKTARVGIDLAGPVWSKKPFRFYILGCSSISKRDTKAEDAFSSD